jgi:ferredoxin
MVIDPEECIDCALCESECPVSAIKPEDELSEAEQVFLSLNAELAPNWPVLTKSRAALADAEEWRDKADKLQFLEK